MNKKEIKCFICKNTEFDELSYLYSHQSESIDNPEIHMLCKDCVKLNAKVCTCDKKFMDQEPTKISITCTLCKNGGNPPNDNLDKVLYFDIQHGENFKELLTKWSDQYYIIHGCRGCKFTKEQIEQEGEEGLKYAMQAAIEACVYKLIPLRGDVDNIEHKTQYFYVSDALDENFIIRAEALGIKLGNQEELSHY